MGKFGEMIKNVNADNQHIIFPIALYPASMGK